MNLIKKCLNRVFVEGLSGMALGLFATLIIGTIIQQIGTLAGGSIGTLIYAVGKMAAGLTCAGIGVGVAYKFQESPMVVLSAATSGMIGGYASKVLAGTLLVDGNLALQGPGEPLGAFIAAYVGIEVGHLIAGKTRLDIILVAFYWYGLCRGCSGGSFHFFFYDVARWSDQLGNGATAIFDGNCGIRSDGHDPDIADQFSSIRCNPKSVRAGSRSCYCGMLL